MLRIAVLAALALAAGCAVGEINFGGEALAKPASVVELDALVASINGYGSPDAYVLDHPREYTDALDTRVDESSCAASASLIESELRATTRSRADGMLRKLVLTWSSTRANKLVTTHESYHYDAAGKLRVVVVDREEDHTPDLVFARATEDHNRQVLIAVKAMPTSTEAEKVAVAQREHDLRDATTISQHRLYFREDGTTLFYETRRDGLEQARATDFVGIGQTPPSLYSRDIHPANVVGTPLLVGLSPHARYTTRPLAEAEITDPASSVRAQLIAANASDGEASLAAPPACR